MAPNVARENNITIDLNIGDQLTTTSCGHIIIELIKFLTYQRLQIPYRYQWLKQIISKKRECENTRDSYQSERYFHIASTALDNLDYVIKTLLKEIEGAFQPQEVCIAFGATPISCKEIYRVILPSLCHKPQCHSTHIASDQKIQRNVFRSLVTSEKLSEVFFESMSPTNMYVFLKKMTSDNHSIICNDSFLLVDGYRIPKSCKVIVLNIKTPNPQNTACCNDFQVFGEVLSEDLKKLTTTNGSNDVLEEIESTDTVKWFQSTYVMKGFKDCIVNGSSIINSW